MIVPDFRNVPWRTLVATVAALFVVLLVLSYCSSRRENATLKDQSTLGDARTMSAVEAIDAIAENAAANNATQTEVKEAQNAIRQADPADRDTVFRRELCKLHGRSPC